jgi:hypothetical protein
MDAVMLEKAMGDFLLTMGVIKGQIAFGARILKLSNAVLISVTKVSSNKVMFDHLRPTSN